MKNGLRHSLLAGLVMFGGAAYGDVTFEIIDGAMMTAISGDGSVITGNTFGEYETFRYTTATGVVPLGRATIPVLGIGAGGPDISDDGTRISASILGGDSTYMTQGVWIEGSGWQETMPPPPPDGGILGDAYGSAWGISGDGETVVGLYWRPDNQPTGLAHPSRWTQGAGVVDLGTGSDGNGNGRANDADYDGNVIVGWDESDFGNWRPTVWVDGIRATLDTNEGFCDASIVDPSGTWIGGTDYDIARDMHPMAFWTWSGSSWDKEVIGNLPGTPSNYGLTVPRDITTDLGTVVGYNRYSNPSDATGFIWTEEGGLVDVENFLSDNDVTVDMWFNILEVSGISNDGSVMIGIGQWMFFPYEYASFIIRISDATGIDMAENSLPAGPRIRALANPSRGATTLMLNLPGGENVGLDVYDISGRLVRNLIDRPISSGSHEVLWDGRDGTGRDVPSGVYFYRLQSGAHRETHKLTIVR